MVGGMTWYSPSSLVAALVQYRNCIVHFVEVLGNLFDGPKLDFFDKFLGKLASILFKKFYDLFERFCGTFIFNSFRKVVT